MKSGNKPVTRRDVAELAGVSETIVSYVLNHSRFVAADKRKRVLEAIEQLHYRPNYIARALKGKGTGQILLIVDNITNDYFGRLAQELDTYAYGRNYLVSLLSAKNEPDFVQRVLSRQADAVLISSAMLDEGYINQMIENGQPVILLMNRDYSTVRGHVARIYTGIESGIMSAVTTLYDQGCRNLVHVDRVSANLHFSGRQDLRYRGFCNQMEALGLPLRDSSFITGCENHEMLFDKVCERIQSDIPVDAFVCRNDRLAATVLNAVHMCKKNVPEEISVIGFDNSFLTDITTPKLSSVALDVPGIASAAMELIDALNAGQTPEEKHMLTTLVLRETTRG